MRLRFGDEKEKEKSTTEGTERENVAGKKKESEGKQEGGNKCVDNFFYSLI